jgi:DNA integrity scanning protein DisA with diadenylate cyclase activity
LQIRTVAAILVWFVVALLLLNRFFMSEWILPISIALTVIAVLVYFSPRIRKTRKSDRHESESASRSEVPETNKK